MIGDKIKELRQALGISAEQVATFLGVAPATVYRYESGDISKMPAKFLKPLAEYLQTTPAYLMGWTNVPEQTISEELTPDEHFVVDSYRSLSSRGKEYVKEQIAIASHVYGEKSASSEKIG